jgi:hypothetical protein
VKNYSAADRSQPPLTKSRQKGPPTNGRSSGPAILAGRPCALTREPDVHRGLRGADGVNLGTAVRDGPANGVSRPKKGRSGDGVEPGHTSRPRDRSKSAHAVEFSKTVAPLRMGFPFQWGASAGTKSRFPRSGPMSIAPDRGRVEARFRRRHHQSTRSPARSQSASAAGRRSRSAPPAARSRARAARRRAESTPMGRSARLAGARGRSCRG